MMVKLRHIITAAIVRPLFYVFARFRYGFCPQAFDYGPIKGPYLIVSNHATDLDALFLALCFREPIYFVANDHLFRLGFISKIISWLASPIPILKSGVDIKTIRDIRALVSDGGSIGLFPEGNRTYNGSTAYIPPAIGKLAKLLKIPIVIYSLEGGYLTSPRWGRSDRKGSLAYKFIRVISYEAYQDMSALEITEIIRRGLRMEEPEAFEASASAASKTVPAQQQTKARYKGKNLAESLERLLYKCPACQAYESLVTQGSSGSCSSCGLTFDFTEEGYLEGPDLPFKRALDWDLWQRADLIKNGLPEREAGQPIFSDQGEVLYEIRRAQESIKAGEGTLRLFEDRLEFADQAGLPGQTGLKIFQLSDIMDMVIYSRQNLQFTLANGKSYVLKNPRPRSAIKYLYHYYYLRQIKRGEMNGFLGI
jgi:1-acyl-sn-glycerol-3-phosphate acyltransferase